MGLCDACIWAQRTYAGEATVLPPSFMTIQDFISMFSFVSSEAAKRFGSGDLGDIGQKCAGRDQGTGAGAAND